MLAAPPRSEHRINLVDEDDTGLEFPREREDRVDDLVGVAVPFFGQGGDVEVYEGGAGLVGESFGEHGFSAAWGSVEENTGGGGEERRSVGVEVRHCKRIDYGFFKFFDDGFEAADVWK